MTSLPLEANAAATLAEWHGLIARRDLSGLPRLLHPDAVFRSPMAHKPYTGAPVVSMILNTVLTVFEDFAYHRQLASADGRSVVLAWLILLLLNPLLRRFGVLQRVWHEALFQGALYCAICAGLILWMGEMSR